MTDADEDYGALSQEHLASIKSDMWVTLEDAAARAMHKVSEFSQAQEQAEPVAWELRKGKTDRVLFEITNNPNRARDWESSLEEVVPLYTKQPRRKPLTREQRKALIESAINACDEEGLLPDMERFAWMIDAVERAHRIGENK